MLLSPEALKNNITQENIGNFSVAIQISSLFEELTEDEKEEELQKFMKISANPGLSWGGRRRLNDDEEDEEVPDMRSFTESATLNSTLDMMQLTIDIQQQAGARTENLTKRIVIDDLKEYTKTNSHGLKEIKLDVSDMKLQGSIEHPEKMDEIHTQYTLSINYNKIYEKSFERCVEDSNFIPKCSESFDDEAGLQTIMMNKIWQNKTATYDEMKEMHDTLMNATKNETSKDKLFEYYHHFLTDKTTVTKVPGDNDVLHVPGGNTPMFVLDSMG